MLWDQVTGLGVWNWFILAGVLLALEILVPGTFMLWLGLSAAVVGLVSLLIAWPWQAQLVAFAVLAIGSLIVWRRLTPKVDEIPAQPFLNRRAEGFIGRVFTLEKPILDGQGTVHIGDTIWQIGGPDLPSGVRVRVISTDGALLMVELADEAQP
jgi:membrane protein implicated in regulation of membrane protease activity